MCNGETVGQRRDRVRELANQARTAAALERIADALERAYPVPAAPREFTEVPPPREGGTS